MARTRRNVTQPTVVEHNPQPSVPQSVRAPEPPDGFKQIFTAAHRPNLRGRVSLYKPLFVPPGVKVALFLGPGTLAGNADFAAAKMNGWEPLPPELATTDVDTAKAEGKVGLLHFDVIDGLVRVGEHVVMVQLERDWYEKYYGDIRALMDAVASPNVTVYEDKVEELVAHTRGENGV